VNEGIVEGGEDAGNAENELACSMRTLVSLISRRKEKKNLSNIPSPARGPRETFSLAAGAFLGGAIATVVLGVSGWNMEKKKSNSSLAVDL
jgi:sulfopyruvate decarboxylase TPP-binding subunit